MKIDLHVHTYFSDGSFSPTEVVNIAIKKGVKFLAITDHDTIAGVDEAIRAAEDKSIKVIPGIEISSKVKLENENIHLVGIYINPEDKKLISFSEKTLENKKAKTLKSLETANTYFKTNISWEDIKKKTKGTPGSAHIAMVLLDKGLIKNISDGIKAFMKGGSCAINWSEDKLSADKSIKMIHDAGGIAILAHLSAYKNVNKFISFKAQEELIKELASYGLDGLEVYIPLATKEEISFGERMAKEYKLLLSCGSDFHDERFIPDSKIGFLDIDKEKISVLRE